MPEARGSRLRRQIKASAPTWREVEIVNKTDVGGVPVTLEEIREARQKLAATGGTAIKQILAAIDNPLAACDYWGEINAALAAHPELKVASQTKSNPAQHAKTVFDFVLAGKEAALSRGEQAAPDTADDAYTPPPRGGEVPKSLVFETDPDKTDRGTTAHKDTQDALAEALRKASLKPRSPKSGDPAFDIAWRDDDAGGVAFICEVKSLADNNETAQIRLAIGQVLDYVHALDSPRKAGSLPPHWEGVHAVRAVVAVERQPAKDVHWTGLCERHGIILTWPEKYADTLAAFAPAGLCDTEFGLPVTLDAAGGRHALLTGRWARPESATLCVTSARRFPVSVVPLPAVPGGQRPDGGGLSVADAVDRYLDGIQATTTRASYAETLTCLTTIVGSRDAGTLQLGTTRE